MNTFYGAEQAAIHHGAFGGRAADAAALLIERLGVAGLSEGRVTDLGCGSGILAAALLQAGYAVDPRAGLDALTSVAARAFDALAPGGVFAFDISTPGRNLGSDVRHVFHDRDTWSLGMHATETDHRLERRIVILSRETNGRYRRVDEHYELVLYDVDAVTDALETVGFGAEVRPSFTQATASQPPSGWAVFVGTKPRD